MVWPMLGINMTWCLLGNQVSLLVAWWYIRVLLPTSGCLSLVTSSCGLLYLKRSYIRSGRTKLIPVQALQLPLQRWMHAWTQTTVPNRAFRYFLSNRSEILGQGNQFFSQGTVPLGAKRLDIGIIGYMLLKTLWEPGIIDCRESLSLFHLFTPIGQGLVVVFFCVWGGVCLLLFGPVPDLSFRYRCLTMTIIAQFNDCHCCNDARSIVQKKKQLRINWEDPECRLFHTFHLLRNCFGKFLMVFHLISGKSIAYPDLWNMHPKLPLPCFLSPSKYIPKNSQLSVSGPRYYLVTIPPFYFLAFLFSPLPVLCRPTVHV